MDPSYNNPLGGSQYPISSGGGDIVLAASNNGSSKKKKILIIGAVLIAVLSIVAIVLLFVLRKTPIAENDYTTKFYVYANLLLSGEDKRDPVDSFDIYSTYYIDEHYSDEPYMDRLSSAYDGFVSAVESSGTELFSETPFSVISDDISILKGINKKEFMNEEDILSYYKQNGKEATLRYVNDYYTTDGEDGKSQDPVFYELERKDVYRILSRIEVWSYDERAVNDMSFRDVTVDGSRLNIKSYTSGFIDVLRGENETK